MKIPQQPLEAANSNMPPKTVPEDLVISVPNDLSSCGDELSQRVVQQFDGPTIPVILISILIFFILDAIHFAVSAIAIHSSDRIVSFRLVSSHCRTFS